MVCLRVPCGFLALAALALTLCSDASAGPYDPPPTYYNSATGTGATLKSQLNSIIDGHTTHSYNAARTILKDTDVDPDNPSRMLLVYDRVSTSTSTSNHSNWNREHTWPRSRGLDTNGAPDGSDLHHLRPSTIQVNSDRGSLNFGGAYGAQSYGVVSDKGNTVWYPGDADAGMIARQQFYMVVRYDGADSGTQNLELVNGNPGIHGTTMGDLARLVEWHYEAPPDDFELRRNDVIYDSYQGNRNPFIDRPEYAWSVFVDQQNDSQLAIMGASVGSDGGSSSLVDLGRVLVGAPVPASRSVTISKAGNAGTYYSVTPSSTATSTISGSLNAFRTGGTDSVTFDVGLNADTLSAGGRAGSVTIDNLDVTLSGGAGRGANDANDVVDMALTVLDHANPSFATDSDLDILTLDFGTIEMGSTMPTLSFELYNLESTAGFTARLELDDIVESGDASRFTTDLLPFVGSAALEAGLSSSFTVSFDTSAEGTFEALYRLDFSDEDLPGTSDLGQLDLVLVGTVEASAVETADFDSDTDVDGIDLLRWQRGYQVGTTLDHGDANGDSVVDGLDLIVWEQQFAGGMPMPGLRVVPEPTSLALCCMVFAFVGISRNPCENRPNFINA